MKKKSDCTLDADHVWVRTEEFGALLYLYHVLRNAVVEGFLECSENCDNRCDHKAVKSALGHVEKMQKAKAKEDE